MNGGPREASRGPPFTEEPSTDQTALCAAPRSARPLPPHPVRRLHQKHILRTRPEDISIITRRRERTHVAIALITSLRPHHEQRRTGPVLPPRHDARVEALLVE